MKFQWSLLVGLFFALIVAIFAVMNVESVPVNYLFGEAEWPLILVILGSALFGAIFSGSVALFRTFVLQRKVKQLEQELKTKDTVITANAEQLSRLSALEQEQKEAAKLDENTVI